MLSTKANTLDALSRCVTRSKINRLVYFTHRDWMADADACLNLVQSRLAGRVAVRSSAVDEDTLASSNAGAFHSELGVPSEDLAALRAAVLRVFASYGDKGTLDPENQVLVQEQSSEIAASGVLTTRSLGDSPYYVITYAEGEDTAAVTSGSGSHVVKISRHSVHVPPRFQPLMAAVYELERLLPGKPLDIEFGITRTGQVLLFQVRALVLPHGTHEDAAIHARIRELQHQVIALSDLAPGLHGESTFLADMTDWNPAEMIGDRASELAYSLYDTLITGEVWSVARASQGYFEVGVRPLVHLLGNKPYVNIRTCFNSFLPSDLPEGLREKLVDYYLARLREDPALQDKVEFEILFTCYDASFPDRAKELLDHGFSVAEVEIFRASLLRLTNNLLDTRSLLDDLETTRQINARIKTIRAGASNQEKLSRIREYLTACKELGTLPFARLARLGFVSAAILKGFVPKVLSQADYEAFYHSVNTIARELQEDTERLSKGELSRRDYLQRYGHLRPGTYEITSLRYDERELHLSSSAAPREICAELRPEVGHALWNALREHGLKGTVLELFTFARLAMEAREEAKFHFTKLLSEVLKLITEVGEALGMRRDELAYMRVEDVLEAIGKSDQEIRVEWRAKIEFRRERHATDSLVEMPPVIFGPEDLDVVMAYSSRPTFITQKSVTTEVVVLGDATGVRQTSVTGKIAVLERGDPGYDWIFAQAPAGLVTKYGGAGSHMAIRCNEFSLPAAIGCGEELFRVALRGGPLTLDCGAKVLRSARITL